MKPRFAYLLIIKPALVTVLLACVTMGYAQTTRPKPGDIRNINALLLKAANVADTNTKAAMVLIAQAKKINAVANIDTLKAKAYVQEGFCNFYSGNYKHSAVLFDSAAYFWKKVSEVNYFKALNDKANALMYNSEYHTALMTFFDCLNISRRLNNNKLTGQVLNNIGLVYESLQDADNALLYEKRSLPYKLAAKDMHSVARTYGNIGNAFQMKGLLDSAIYNEKVSYSLYVSAGDEQGMSSALGDIGNTYYKKKELDSCITYLLRAFSISQKLNNAENKANLENDLATAYLEKHDLRQAWKYALLESEYVPQITDNEFLQAHYDLMYRYYKQTGNTARAFEYLEKLNAVNDSVFKEKINIQNQKIAFEYEYKQKKLTDSLVFQKKVNISAREATASRNRLIIALLLLLLVASLAIIWYSRNKLLKKQLALDKQNLTVQEQKIRELENEKQIMASQAVLKGQEEERSRLAKDLHDGLGGLLSGVKHSIINMKENQVIGADGAATFEKSLDMIDTAMKELRRVAQNMMPEALAKFGLEAALKDYCASACTSTVTVMFQAFGKDLKIDNAVEIIIYRIIQELVNNAIKHADATQVVVQLIKGDDWVTLGVEDNGRGFNVDGLKDAAGAGWSNIKSRVEYLNGNIDLKSQEGTGTSVNIEIKIPAS